MKKCQFSCLTSISSPVNAVGPACASLVVCRHKPVAPPLFNKPQSFIRTLEANIRGGGRTVVFKYMSRRQRSNPKKNMVYGTL